MSRIVEAANNAGRLSKTLPVDVKSIVKQYGIELREFDFEAGISGALVIKDGLPSIGYNRGEAGVRQRFTIAHELGHFILHKDQDLFIDTDFKVMFRSTVADGPLQRQEREANEFAACLLMPEAMVRKQLELFGDDCREEDLVSALATSFDVSTIAMSIRLSRLGLFR